MGAFKTNEEHIFHLLSELRKKDEQIEKAIDLAVRYGQIDGGHHKTWVIDQIVRILAGDNYDNIIADACDGEDGTNTYDWDTGIAP